jgi:hypothetical protein
LGKIVLDLPLPEDGDLKELADRAKRVRKKQEKFDVGGVVTATGTDDDLSIPIPPQLVKKKHIKAGDRFIVLASEVSVVCRRILGQDKELT